MSTTDTTTDPRDIARAILIRRASRPVQPWEIALTEAAGADRTLVNFELFALTDALSRSLPRLPDPGELLAAVNAESTCAQCTTLARILADTRRQETRRRDR